MEWITPALDIVPKVEDLFDSRVSRPAEWWVLDRPFLDDPEGLDRGVALARNIGRRIEFSELCFWNPRHFVAHEYTHWVIRRSESFQTLPYFIEEGLAEWVARELTGWDVSSSRGVHVKQEYSLTEGKLSLDPFGWDELSADELGEARVLAFSVVDAIGLNRLRELAAAGATRRDYLRAAAEASDEFTYTEPESEPHELATDEE